MDRSAAKYDAMEEAFGKGEVVESATTDSHYPSNSNNYNSVKDVGEP